MKAITIRQHGGPEQLVIAEVPMPEPAPGQVLIRVRAFGLNRAELYMRQGTWGEVARIPGIECVGEVETDPSGALARGQKVLAIMGGMGRSLNGSHAEYVCAPRGNVVPVHSDLGWAALAALPESYATAWTCLHRNLAIRPGQTLMIRGAASALGQAALNIAAEAGAVVIAAVRSADKRGWLLELGASAVWVDDGHLAPALRQRDPEGVDAVLDIVGTATLLDSLAAVRREGRVCMAGFLGGQDGIAGFNPLLHMPSSVSLSFFASFMFGSPAFPLSDVPLAALIDRAAAGIYRAQPAHVFAFDELPAAHRLMESNRAVGKSVVVV